MTQISNIILAPPNQVMIRGRIIFQMIAKMKPHFLLFIVIGFFFVTPAGASESSHGADLYLTCSPCHGASGEGGISVMAPAIAGQYAWYIEQQIKNFQSGVRGAHSTDVSGLKMRAMSRALKTEADVKKVASYISALPKPFPQDTLQGQTNKGQIDKGQMLYATCTACHGPSGEGNAALKAPALNHLSDWYIFAQIIKFKSGLRGSDPRDAGGMLMKPMAETLADEQAIKDVTAYIGSLR